MRNTIKFILLLLVPYLSNCQQSDASMEALESKLDSLIQSTMEAEHIPGAAFIIVQGDKTILKKGYGYTSLGEEIARVSTDSTIFRIGSITKTFTSTALLQLVDRGSVSLSEDVNNYLKSVKVPNTYKKAVTPAHLLNHSAGFDEIPGRVVYQEDRQIPLSEFLEDRLVRLREPGEISSYSSYGIALAGLLVEEVSGNHLADFMKQNIWKPLGMNMTSMKVKPADERYASWGYEYRNGINVPQPWEYYHTYPASDIYSTVDDVGKYLKMHLGIGTYNNKEILSKEMALAMQTPQPLVHPEVESFCYGFYEENAEGFQTIGHGGDMLGYSSYMAIVPEKNLGIFVVHHHEGTRLRYQVLGTILNHFNPNRKSEKINKISGKDLSKFTGEYVWSTYCHSCEDAWRPDPVFIVENDDHTLTVFGLKFIQTDQLLFQTEDGSRKIGFTEDGKGKIKYMSSGASNMFERIN